MSDPTPILSTATLGLEDLFSKIQAETLERYPIVPPATVAPVACVFGWREPTKQINQGPAGAARVVLSPGDPTGKIGDLTGASGPGRNPAPLATMVELATLYLWARDANDPSDLAQWRAARRVHDLVVPILIRNYKGRWKQISKQWVRSDLERQYGAEMQLVIAIEAYVPDDVQPEAPGGTVKNIDLTLASLSGSGTKKPC